MTEQAYTEEELHDMWVHSIKRDISQNAPLIVINNDAEDLIDTFTSYYLPFQQMRSREEEGEVLADVDQEIYVLLVETILLPILSRMKELGYEEWVQQNEFSYEM